MHKRMMNTGKLDARLSAAAEFVRSGAVAADIGTDHGYLICELAQKEVIKRGFACDINEMPLNSARANIKSLMLEEKITAVLTDGLRGLPLDEIDDVIICGMGGETIAGIIDDAGDSLRNSSKHLVLQPMTKADLLRRRLCESGWRIDAEQAVEVEGHLYSVMSVFYSGKSFEPEEIFCYTGELPKCGNAAALRYLEHQAAVRRKVSAGLEKQVDGAREAAYQASLAMQIDMEREKMLSVYSSRCL